MRNARMDFIEKFYHPDFDGRQIGDLKLCYCGRRTGAPDHRFGPAARENYWFIYLKEGSGIYTVGGVTRRLKKGCVFAAFPMRRIFYKADPGSVWSIYWVSIAADNLDGYLESTGITEDNPVIEVESPGAIESIFESLLMTIPNESLRAKFDCVSLVYKLLAGFSPTTRETAGRDYVDEAIFYMTNNYDRPITAAETAARLNLDRSYFSRLFRGRTGMSPTDWLLDYRLSKAKALMRATDLKIGEIARSVGFDDPLYFTRRFRAKCGVSPAEWRKENTTAKQPG